MKMTRGRLALMTVLLSAGQAFGQGTNLQIIRTQVGDEGAISVKWKSESNAVYRIDYASQLANTNTQWQILYQDYPSHGTNTFWMDNGDYTLQPPVKRPKNNPMRFYRIAKTGTNTAPAPFVRITSPASNAVVSGEITVSVTATSRLAVLDARLFVDGLEMPGSDDGTNFLVNTSEWANGPHALFAIARGQSEMGGVPGVHNITYGRAVSPYIPVTFDNYISQFYFSEPFFEPALGQTQRVTAAFSAYSTWTLQVLDESSNAVRTATGTGGTLQFDWDGTGDGGISIPDGVYEYQITAQQTTPPAPPPGGGGGPRPPPAPRGASVTPAGPGQPWHPRSATEALMAGMSSYWATPPPMPPIRKDGKWYRWEELYGPVPAMEIQIPLAMQEAYLQARAVASSTIAVAGAMAGPAAAKAPTKPPVKPAKNAVATFGIAYWTFPGGRTNQVPLNGIGGRVTLDGQFTVSVVFPPVLDFTKCAQGFSKAMSDASWKVGFHKFDNTLQANALIRNDLAGYSGSNLFNQVNLGLFISHGNFGTTLDFSPAAGQSKQTYFPAGGAEPANTWIRLSDFRFGDNLRWMAILACNSLQEDAYQTMYNKMVLPIGDQTQAWANQLHLLLGCRTYAAVSPNFGELWAKKMKGRFFSFAQPVWNAWFNTGIEVYLGQPRTGIFTNDIYFKAVGWDTTFGDKLRLYTNPDPSVDTLTDLNQKVYP